MLQKLKVTSYAFIYFLMFGFSFIALQVTTEEVEAAGVCEPVDRIKQRNNADSQLWFQRCAESGSKNTCGNRAEWPRGDGGRCMMTAAAGEVEAAGVCEPVERIRIMKDTARHSDYTVWAERCQVSGSNGQCGNRTEWPVGDGGRCAMSSAAATVSAQDVNPNAVPERGAAQNNTGEVCHPNDRITDMYNTKRHTAWAYGQERCEREGVNAEVCATGWGEGRCIWGIPPQLGPLDTSVAAKSQAIEDCKKAVASTYNRLGGRDGMLLRQRRCDP